ncbi:hypothetical protein BaRGS_00019245 [Batillaria attramentaria]|uniref:Uncharacterized protein n=1 Tax=Batillaria attramentaria TaxID=370345 RepID=A0ABD0KQ94_9CAEN
MTAWEKVPVDVSPDQRMAWSHFSHFSYSDFGRSDILCHWKPASIIRAGMAFGLLEGLMDYSFVTNGRFTTFDLGIEITFDQALWTVPLRAQFPYKVSTELEDIGKTSATLFCRLVNKLDNKTLATYRLKMVYVDQTTRRPAPFPDWFQQKYNSGKKQNVKPFVLPKSAPQVPVSAFTYRVTVPAGDVNAANHNNQASYFRYCCDAAQAAISEGHLLSFSPDISEMMGVFAGDSNQGDLLCVSLWQQDDQPNSIRFVITRKEGIQQPIIFHASMTFGMTPVRAARL